MGERTSLQRAEAIVAQKLKEKSALIPRAKQAFRDRARSSRYYMLGRDHEGKAVSTMAPESLNIYVSGWLVQTIFKPDDLDKVEGKDWHVVEVMEKNGTVPNTVVTHENHIITATRGLKHVRENYERSVTDAASDNAAMEKEMAQVRAFYQLNIDMADKKDATVKDIEDHIQTLESFIPLFKNKRSALAKIVGKGRLEEAIRKFKHARDALPENRAAAISLACAVFVSVNERITTWKSKKDAEKNARTDGREAALRVERDRWLKFQFSKFASNPEQALKFAKLDAEKKESMGILREKLEAARKLGQELRRLKRNENPSDEQLQRIKEKEAELKKARNDAHRYFHAKKGLCTENGRKPAAMLAHHSWIDRYLLQYDFDKALGKVDYFIQLLDSNKPRFILDELSKDPDPYLETAVLPALKLAVEAMEAEQFKTAKGHFENAETAMGAIVHPQADRHENQDGLPLTEHIQKGGDSQDY